VTGASRRLLPDNGVASTPLRDIAARPLPGRLPVVRSTAAGRLRLCLSVLLAVGCLCGCALGPGSSAAPPTKVCGQTLASSAAGAVVDDVSRSDVTVRYDTVGSVVILQLTRNCAHGAVLNIRPARAARVTRTAEAKDGKPAAVVLAPATETTNFDVQVSHPDGRMTVARVRLSTSG
jgi:hypothetical protein